MSDFAVAALARNADAIGEAVMLAYAYGVVSVGC
jgi:hypothetical protein